MARVVGQTPASPGLFAAPPTAPAGALARGMVLHLAWSGREETPRLVRQPQARRTALGIRQRVADLQQDLAAIRLYYTDCQT